MRRRLRKDETINTDLPLQEECHVSNVIPYREGISTPKSPKTRLSATGNQIIAGFILVFFLIITAFPLVWTLISSLKSSQEILTSALSLPEKPQWINYVNAVRVTGITKSYLNSVIVTALSVVINAYIALLAAYVFARFRFPARQTLMLIFALGILIPVNSALLPIKLIMDYFKLSNSLTGLAILYSAIGLPTSILILSSHITGIPPEIDESARIDGASWLTVVNKIIVPIAHPGLVTVAILQAIYCWNEFLFAMVLVSSEAKRTLQVAIRFFVGRFFFDYGGLFAAMVLAILPLVIVFIVFQNSIVSALSSGAIKF